MSKALGFILIGLFVGNVTLYANLFSVFQEPDLALHFLSVGQADAESIRSARSTVLIDAGIGKRTIEALDAVLPSYDRTIDVAIITHPNLDHYGGMDEVLERYRVRLVLMTGAEVTTAEFQKLLTLLREKEIPILYAMRGEEIAFGKNQIQILSPREPLFGKNILRDKLNDTSIVAKLVHPGLTALFTGDISSKLETNLQVGDADILKVPHHGSKFSSSLKFLQQVSPKYAVIEVGKNSYGHPTSETLSRLASVGAKVFRTDLDGTISFLVRDGKVEIRK